jgi:hypothetical protein
VRKEVLLKAVFSFGSAPRLYNEDPRPAERIIERKLRVGSAVELGKVRVRGVDSCQDFCTGGCNKKT